MLLQSGQTAVIGGLTTDSEVETVSRVPFISRIPVVGELFKHRIKDRSRRSLIVFVTPTIVHSSAEQEMIVQRELARRRERLREQVEGLIAPQQ